MHGSVYLTGSQGADVVLLMREHRRALSLYHQLDDLIRSLRQPTDRVKFKLAKCYMALQDHPAALKELRSIPSKSRTCQVNVMLGRLLRLTGHKEQAVACLKDAQRELPVATEIIDELVDLGISDNEVEFNEGNDGATEFGKTLLRSLVARRDSDFGRCVESLETLNAKFPNHPLVLSELSVSLVQADKSQMVHPLLL